MLFPCESTLSYQGIPTIRYNIGQHGENVEVAPKMPSKSLDLKGTHLLLSFCIPWFTLTR